MRGHRAERVRSRGELWVQCSCGEAVTCGRGKEFGHSGHTHNDDCLPLVCPGTIDWTAETSREEPET